MWFLTHPLYSVFLDRPGAHGLGSRLGIGPGRYDLHQPVLLLRDRVGTGAHPSRAAG
ncbi:hypothetical protein Ae717Ps2_4961 [Pseudonocardia sp. Ae717_Ps2]|nr:hypothetical protein Ae505Ps2_1052 [Pseudonocardia sp. Ae505_Ps2]OLM34065.1 hypothetical protein Ae717Ps2_4961 [Pseudonocardia sp. Ae717_Ps2]